MKLTIGDADYEFPKFYTVHFSNGSSYTHTHTHTHTAQEKVFFAFRLH
jgi:hypothetical protein